MKRYARAHLDYETYCDLDIKSVGGYRYCRDPSLKILLATVYLFDGSGNCIRQETYDSRTDGLHVMPGLVQIMMESEEVWAWNAEFEREVTESQFPATRGKINWRCTKTKALYCAFPASLDDFGKAVLGHQKPAGYTRLLNIFTKPKGGKEKPGDWQSFIDYNINDVELETRAYTFLRGYDWPAHEIAIWQLSDAINARGVPLDVERALLGRQCFEYLKQNRLDEIKQITGVDNPNSGPQLRNWLHLQGCRTASLDKEAVKALLASELTPTVRRVLELKAEAAQTGAAKFESMLDYLDGDVMRGMLQCNGAGRTHRWAGRGPQPQNMRRGLASDEAIEQAWAIMAQSFDAFDAIYPKPIDTLSDLVRTPFGGGREVAVADYSSIEVVMLQWAAGAKGKLKELADGLDPYKVFATTHFGVAYDKVTKPQRTFSKPPVLGGGYGLGAATLIDYAAGMGVQMSETEAKAAIASYREQHPEVVSLWYGLQEAMIATIKTGKPHRYGHVVYRPAKDGVLCSLPSGSAILYYKAHIVPGKYGDAIAYYGVDSFTGQWGLIHTWGGKLTENVVQSISRDVLCHGLQNAERRDIDVFLHVHDEIVAVNEDDSTLPTLLSCMVAPDWCADAPIKAAGFTAPWYRKD